jgi:hypothetical protein
MAAQCSKLAPRPPSVGQVNIQHTLRKQIAYLFKDALDIRAKVRGVGASPILHGLAGPSLALAVQKPFAWEYRLFGQVLADEIARTSFARSDLEYGIALGQGVRLHEVNQFVGWIEMKLGEIQGFVQSASAIVNVALAKALGEPGEPGNLDEIVYAAQRLGQVYQRLVEWSLEFARVQIPDKFCGILRVVSRASRNVISELEAYSRIVQDMVNDAVSRYEATGEPQQCEIPLVVTCPNMEDLDLEIRKLLENLDQGDFGMW